MSKSKADADIILKIEHVSKVFKLPHDVHSSLKATLVNFKGRRTFEVLDVLRNINIEVKRGEFFGIVGRNGSGKSTLLKLIAGIYEPTKGKIHLHGQLTPFIELGVGFNPELTGRENVYLNGAILGLTTKEIDAKYEEIVAFAELERFMDQKLKNYSSGMQVRLAFSIAIQAHNDILLIDEVLAVGDAKFQRKCFEVFKQIKGHKTVIFISHDMNAVKEFCERAVLINDGEIISQGDPEKVANNYIQLFNENAQSNEDNTKRWGDRRAEISNVKTEVTREKLHISYKVTAHETIKNPIFGVIIRDAEGNHLYDANTKWKKVSTGVLEDGESATASWDLPNVFKDGRYKITVAAAHEDAFAFYDWQEDVMLFDVARGLTTAGMLVLDDTIKVRKQE